MMRPLLLFSLWFLSCSVGPKEVDVGKDVCARCRMIIADIRFASEIVNDKGKVFKFDSIECMTAGQSSIPNIQSFWVKDFHQPSGWLEARTAMYLKSKTLPSPMGGYLSAYATREQADDAQTNYGGDLLSWDQLSNRSQSNLP